ncbi:unnamed protein product [Ranitomeya imitator]|uniref:YEATS domain-containing protein n=1 Tax=Ranitomeya imitator TaxID=111125 RepID=A0ABN9M9R9_9NEOB|nr:unnamed protein product [Ranitomeya imitator]
MKKKLLEIIEKQAKFGNFAPLKTKEIVHWCRNHGYTPPDPETATDERESFEDVLTRIDNEAALPSSYSSPNALCRKMDELEKVLQKEKEVEEDVDILSTEVEHKPHIKKEKEEGDVKFYLTPSLSCEFIRDTAQEIGVSLQPVEVHKNVYASPVEEMMLKATQQFVSDLLRDALAVGYQMTSRKSSESQRRQALLRTVESFRLRGVIITPVPKEEIFQGFYSNLFIIGPKKYGSVRPILDLKSLDRFDNIRHFRMESLRTNPSGGSGHLTGAAGPEPKNSSFDI